MSEAELHVLRARLRGGIINKARRPNSRYAGQLVLFMMPMDGFGWTPIKVFRKPFDSCFALSKGLVRRRAL
jgi:hypothetical protein